MSTLNELSKIAYDLFLNEFRDHDPQQFTLPLNPCPASRPRVTKHGVHFSDRYKHFKEHAVGPCNSFTGRKTDKPVAILIEHVVERTNRKPYPPGDLDNYDKGPLDAMVKSGQFFDDDIQVIFMISFKRYAKPHENGAVYVTWFDFDI